MMAARSFISTEEPVVEKTAPKRSRKKKGKG